MSVQVFFVTLIFFLKTLCISYNIDCFVFVEAGKLALNLVKGEPAEDGIVEEREMEGDEQEVTSETVLDGATIDGAQIQQVITDDETGVRTLQ